MSRFDKTYCSQCGGVFGPGDEGYSHCSDHQRPEFTAVDRLRNGGQPDLADQVEAEIRAAYNKARERDEQVSRLFDAWVNTHGGPIPWAKAVEIVAIVNQLSRTERAQLLSLAEEV